MSGPSDQLELELAARAETGSVGGPVIGSRSGPIGDGQPTAQIIRFPTGTWSPLSTIASAIFRDMCRRSISADGLACHSIKDGMTCSGAPRHKVVQARRELQDKCFVTLIRAGSEEGPAIWRINRTRQIAF